MWLLILGASRGQGASPLFAEFVERFGRLYSSPEEVEFRFRVFQKNLQLVQSSAEFIDAGGRTKPGLAGPFAPRSFKLGINQFADMSDEEFNKYYLIPENIMRKYKPMSSTKDFFPVPPVQKNGIMTEKNLGSEFGFRKVTFSSGSQFRMLQTGPADLPRSVDWVAKGVISEVKNQNLCNSCYAFAATSAVEAYARIQFSENVSLSEQEIVDCDKENVGCTGGQPEWAFDYMIAKGLSSDSDYPYLGKTQTCMIKTTRRLENALKLLRNQSEIPYKSKQARFLQYSVSQYKNYFFDSEGKLSTTPVSTVVGADMSKIKGIGKSKAFLPPPKPVQNHPYQTTVTPPNPTPPNPIPPNPTPPNPIPPNPTPPNPTPPNPTPSETPSNPPLPSSPNTQVIPNRPSDYQSASLKRFRKVTGYTPIDKGVLNLISALAKGPVVIAQHVSSVFKFYSTGVYMGTECNQNLMVNHAVLAVGYDLDDKIPYIKIKNSWGPEWGQQGFYKLAIGELSNKNLGSCNIAIGEYTFVPVLKS